MKRHKRHEMLSSSDTKDESITLRDRSSSTEKKCRKKKRCNKRQHSSCDISHSSNTEDESVTSSDRSSNFFGYSKDFKIHELQILSGKKIQYQDGGIHISAEKVYVIVQPAATISLKFRNLSLNIKTSLDGE
ncbi:hypothetical protein BDQ17DRAFT_1332873 [Cyathus striatus]|nr:hypothetical protein BDQ17DRAFT_1332873 [Cyathus striatus]